MQEKILNNKKLLLVIAGLLVVGIIIYIVIIVNRNTTSSPETNDTDSSEFDKELDATYAILSNYPISNLLPAENENPYYYITYRLNESDAPFKIEIFYRASDGLSSAKSRLTSSEFSQYNPAQYNIIYTKLDD